LQTLSQHYRLALVSNIDDDLLAATRLGRDFDLVCMAERARGYKPDGTLFCYLIDHAGVAKDEILHSGQSQFTDMVGAKPLGLTVAWINRRGIELHPSVPGPDFTFLDIASLIPTARSRQLSGRRSCCQRNARRSEAGRFDQSGDRRLDCPHAPRDRQRFGALYRGFRAHLARGLRELGCSRRSKARSWSVNRWNPANVG
jgi:hypothetical protein